MYTREDENNVYIYLSNMTGQVKTYYLSKQAMYQNQTVAKVGKQEMEPFSSCILQVRKESW